MSKNYGTGTQYPTVNLAVNKSRIKLYGSTTINPTYYLNKGQEFQIELFNPTTDVVLARISLNGKLISDGGLIVKPGERVFLDRFLDENKKFLFDTYQVDNIEAVKQAIKDNGDLEVAFHREVTTSPFILCGGTTTDTIFFNGNDNGSGNYYGGDFTTTTNTNNSDFTVTTNGNVGLGTTTPASTHTTTNTGHVTLDGMNDTGSGIVNNATGEINLNFVQSNVTQDIFIPTRSANTSVKKNKKSLAPMKSSASKGRRRRITKTTPTDTIETGRVEKGSTSKQKIETVEMEFETYAFHTVSYKMLPSSQKNVTSDEVINKYCPNCGAKNKQNNKFCPSCGKKR